MKENTNYVNDAANECMDTDAYSKAFKKVSEFLDSPTGIVTESLLSYCTACFFTGNSVAHLVKAMYGVNTAKSLVKSAASGLTAFISFRHLSTKIKDYESFMMHEWTDMEEQPEKEMTYSALNDLPDDSGEYEDE